MATKHISKLLHIHSILYEAIQNKNLIMWGTHMPATHKKHTVVGMLLEALYSRVEN